MKKHSLIRAIYLYLFTIIGLTLLIIGSVKFVDMGLKAFVFTKAEDPQEISQSYKYYSVPPIPMDKIEAYQEEEVELSTEEKAAVKQWIDDYKRWQEAEAKIDYVASQRQKEASQNLAFILIGLPLYLFHWRIIRRETKEQE